MNAEFLEGLSQMFLQLADHEILERQEANFLIEPGTDVDTIYLIVDLTVLDELREIEEENRLNGEPVNEVNLEIGGLVDVRKRKAKVSIRKKIAHLSGGYQKIKEGENILDETCVICQEQFKISEYKRELPSCGHVFHKKCIDSYFCKFNDKMECPLCRVSYSEPNK